MRCGILITPLAHRGEHGPKVTALGGQFVIEARRVLAVGNADKNASFDEGGKAKTKDISRYSESPLEFLETCDAKECVSNDEHAPPFANDLEALSHRTVHSRETLTLHRKSV
jgi:hypothetical protein